MKWWLLVPVPVTNYHDSHFLFSDLPLILTYFRTHMHNLFIQICLKKILTAGFIKLLGRNPPRMVLGHLYIKQVRFAIYISQVIVTPNYLILFILITFPKNPSRYYTSNLTITSHESRQLLNTLKESSKYIQTVCIKNSRDISLLTYTYRYKLYRNIRILL